MSSASEVVQGAWRRCSSGLPIHTQAHRGSAAQTSDSASSVLSIAHGRCQYVSGQTKHIHRAKALQTNRAARVRNHDEDDGVRERRMAAAKACASLNHACKRKLKLGVQRNSVSRERVALRYPINFGEQTRAASDSRPR
eukprot:TRINITY_DN12451_c0_g1_i1.p1 TRINITY_DN12451_c0_g1~~TRINITY_DN12451_c0_g1_i1.p1  ORF type:complete len:139 (-),score=6.21 TRINITY_DN12451_c0_g1_i1:1907-2323(-)